MNKILVIIPTRNHRDMMADVLSTIEAYNGPLFSFAVHDSSDNDETHVLVDQFNNTHEFGKIDYIKYGGDVSVDEKAKIAVEKNPYPYFLLLGDGCLYDFASLENTLLSNSFDDYGVIDLETDWRIGYLGQDSDKKVDQFYECDDPVEFAKKYYSHLTFWGGSILETNLIVQAFKRDYYKKSMESDISWWLPLCIFNELNRENPRTTRMATIYTGGLGGNPKKKDHSWSGGESYYKIAFEIFNRDVELLDEVYAPVRKDIVSFFRRDSLATTRYLLSKRRSGELNLRLVKKYKKDIKYVDGYYGKMVALCLVPRFIIAMIYGTYHCSIGAIKRRKRAKKEMKISSEAKK